jgi:hypothetical protein
LGCIIPQESSGEPCDSLGTPCSVEYIYIQVAAELMPPDLWEDD